MYLVYKQLKELKNNKKDKLARLKQLFSDTVLYGISTVVSRFLNYLLVPFYTKFFDPAEYGVIGLVYGAMIFLNVLVSFGMESAYIRYGAEKADRKRSYQQLQWLVMFVSLALGTLFWIFSPWGKELLSLQNDSNYIYEMMLGILVLDAFSIIPFADLRLERKAVVFTALRISNVVINVGLNLYLVILKKWGLEAVLISNLIASGVTTIFAVALTFKGFSFQFDSSFLKKALRFGLPYIPAGIGYAINEVLDRFLINAMHPSDIEKLYGIGVSAQTLTGIYNACYKLGIFMVLFIQMFRMAWQPFYMSHHKDDGAKKVFRQSFIGLNIVAGILVLAIGLFRTQIASFEIPFTNAFLIGEAYWSGLDIVPFLLIAYWFQLWYTHFTAGIVIAEKTSILSHATFLGAGVTVVSNLLLLPVYGLIGAAISTMLSYLSMAVYMLIQTEKYYPINYPWIKTSLGVVAVAVMLFWQMM